MKDGAFEFPQNTLNIDKRDYFFENNNEFDDYKFDYFDSLLISRSGINDWSLSYKEQISFFIRIRMEGILQKIETVTLRLFKN